MCSSQIFISYSSGDKIQADVICDALESSGVKCWIAPRDILPGKDYAEGIIEAIESCTLFLLILSESSNASSQVRREVERAGSKNIPIMPVRIDTTEPKNLHKTLEYFIATHHWLDACQGPIQDHLGNISDKVYRFLEGQGPGQNGSFTRRIIEPTIDASRNSSETSISEVPNVRRRNPAMAKTSVLGFVILIVVGGWIFILKERKVPERAKEKPIEAATQNSSEGLWNIWSQLESLSEVAQEDLSVSLNQTSFKLGETVVITCEIQRDGYLNVLNMNKGDDAVTVLFPNAFHKGNKVEAGKRVVIPGESDDFELRAQPPVGKTLVAAFLSEWPLNAYTEGGVTQMNRLFSHMTSAVTRGFVVKAKQTPGKIIAVKVKARIER